MSCVIEHYPLCLHKLRCLIQSVFVFSRIKEAMIIPVRYLMSYRLAMFASGSIVIPCAWYACCACCALFPQSIDMLRQAFDFNLLLSHGVHRHCKACRQFRERCSCCCRLRCRRRDGIPVALQRVQHLMGHCCSVVLFPFRRVLVQTVLNPQKFSVLPLSPLPNASLLHTPRETWFSILPMFGLLPGVSTTTGFLSHIIPIEAAISKRQRVSTRH